MDSRELHLLYILLDSNLPTGGFVSSSGLESYAKHGFLSRRASGSTNGGPSSAERPSSVAEGITEFSRAEVENYHSTTSVFVKEAWKIAHAAVDGGGSRGNSGQQGGKGKAPDRSQANEDTGRAQSARMTVNDALEELQALDRHHESCLLSHVSRRASKAQGIAMLTLYSRGLSRPPGVSRFSGHGTLRAEESGSEQSTNETEHQEREERAKEVIDGYKRLIRTAASPGHLAVCWGVMTAALGLPQGRALHLHLFLHARSLLSSAVRLNLIGPYLSSQLLLHPFEEIIASQLKHPPAASNPYPHSQPPTRKGQFGEENDDPWAWAERRDGPATTYPLGEILMARHDQQHSRIFNS